MLILHQSQSNFFNEMPPFLITSFKKDKRNNYTKKYILLQQELLLHPCPGKHEFNSVEKI